MIPDLYSPALVVVPKTLIWNWESEAKRFAPDLNLVLYRGTHRDQLLSGICHADLVITSYGLVRQDNDILSKISWEILILDESQAIKNPKARISIAVKALNASNRICLTGTPIENRTLDLWSQFDFLMPGFLGDKSVFLETYTGRDPKALDRLKVLTAPFILRRMKTQVCKELPPKTEITLLCGFSKEQKTCYDQILETGRHCKTGLSLEKTGSVSMQILTVLLRLRQAACHPALVHKQEDHTGIKPEESSEKFERILETAIKIFEGGYKILIFSQFVALLELVKQMFENHGIEHHSLYGETRQKKQVVRAFKKSPGPCAFLISLKAGGVGLNLTEAGYVFLLDPWWNPAVENQAIDRSYRIGQENPVTVLRFITQNSVEEGVSRLQAQKRQLGDALLDRNGLKDVPFTEKELLSLIS